MRSFGILCAAAAFCGACENRPPEVPETCGKGLEPYVGTPETFRTVRIWVQDDAELSPIDVKEGCETWLPKGVQCELVPHELLGDVTVYAVREACREDEANGGYVLATAESNGRIRVFLECLRLVWPTEADGVDPRVLRLVVGHEVGHEAGMWWHVPEDCAEAERVHPSGAPVCGEALMNPQLDPNTCFLTEADGLAYDVRDPGQSPFDFKRGGSPAGCVLTAADY
jgi:hypothetical protein